jgi:ribosomal protein L37AE/L43A
MRKEDPKECSSCHSKNIYLAANGFWICNDCQNKPRKGEEWTRLFVEAA